MGTPAVIGAALFEIADTGKEAHASAFPELGVNAGDALTIAQVAIGLLRQHIGQTDRVHGIITKGGDAPNVIPAHTNAKYMIRADTLDQLQNLAPKARRCFEAGAPAPGARLEITGGEKPHAHVLRDAALAALHRRHAEALGRALRESPAAAPTRMGHVSLGT